MSTGFRSLWKPMYRCPKRIVRGRLFGFQGDLNPVIRCLTCLDYSNYCVQHAFSSSTHEDAMEANSLDNFPPGWSDSSLQRATTMMQIHCLVPYWSRFLHVCDVGTDTPTVQPALPRRFTQPKSDEDVERVKQAASKHKHPQ